MSEKKFTCVLGKDYHIINNNVDNMSYYLQDGNDVVLVINLINRLVEENEQLQKQVKSFETTMNATSDYNAFLESKITTLEKENKELNSIKKFAEKNGINIFLIDEAFRKCWKDNGKLFEENEQLKQEIKQYWKCRDKWKQEAKELKKEADYFERKKCEYWNMYNEAHSDRIILKKENEQLRHELDSLTGCYCADNKEFKDYWRIGYDD